MGHQSHFNHVYVGLCIWNGGPIPFGLIIQNWYLVQFELFEMGHQPHFVNTYLEWGPIPFGIIIQQEEMTNHQSYSTTNHIQTFLEELLKWVVNPSLNCAP